jgi:tetratricopeptide (TPR) repeat protein
MPLAPAEHAGLIALIILRATVLGCVADYELADTLAERYAQDAPTEGMAFVARAQARAALHRFQDALNDLDMAESLDQRPAPAVVAAERAAIFQATGHYQQALRLRQEAVDRHADFETLGALAGVRVELGQIGTAAALFDAARRHYRGVSPFPLVLLDFQCGHMWQRHGDLERARKLFAATCRHVPQYVPAQGPLGRSRGCSRSGGSRY